jgi:uncharacterized protein Yka (UPF0111/DUF47 family)
MADASSFNLQSLLPQRGPLEAFQKAASDPAAFSAAFIWGIIFFGAAVFLWVLCQWALVWWKTRQILKHLNGITPENAAEQRERLWKNGDLLWQELDSTLIEDQVLEGDHDHQRWRVWLRRSVDAAQVFNERSLARRLIHSRLISATSGLLTALGVLGAFIGLQQGISGLRFVNPQPGEMEASIQTLVNGLTIKFSSSIWGIGCSIIFNVLEKLVEGAAWSHIRHVQARIDGLFSRYTPETALSRLQISSAESEQILRGLATAIGGHIQQALAQVGQYTSQAIGEAMQPAVEMLTGAAEKMKIDLSTGSAEGLAQGIEAAAKSLEQSLNAVGDRYNQQFMDLSTRLTSAFEGLQSPITQLSTALGKQDTALADAVKRLEAHAGLAASFTTAATTMQSAAEGLVTLKASWELASSRNEAAASSQERAAGSNERVAERFAAISGDLDEFRQSINAAVQVVSALGLPMQELHTILKGLPEIVTAIEGTRKGGDEERQTVMRQITTDLAETIRKAAEQLAGHGAVADSLRAAAGLMAESTRSIEGFATHIREAATKQEKAALAAESAAHSNAQIAGALEKFPEQIDAMSQGLAQAAESVKQTASVAAQSYDQAAEQQRRFVQGLADGLGQFAEKIREALSIYGDDVQAQTKERIEEFAKHTKVIVDQLANLEFELKGDLETVEVVANRMRETAPR